MSVILAKCKEYFNVKLPEGETCSTGDILPCPLNCKNKQGGCKNRSEFEVVRVTEVPDSDGRAKAAIEYSAEERERSFKAANRIESVSQQQPSSENLGGISSGINKWASILGAGGSNTIAPKEPEENFDKLPDLKKLVIGGRVFSDDACIKRRREERNLHTSSLSEAVDFIFHYWYTEIVFNSEGGLTDEFKWLLSKVLPSGGAASAIKTIVSGDGYHGVKYSENSSVRRSQKFFHIFYDVVYKRLTADGFYWYDGEASEKRLVRLFADKDGFISRFCNEEAFRNFYSERKNEILHFLFHRLDKADAHVDLVEDERRLFSEITETVAAKQSEIIFLDDSGLNTVPQNLGSIREFIFDMRRPTDRERMSLMCRFLKKYKITSSESVIIRDELFDKFEMDDEGEYADEDDRIYGALELKNSANYAGEYYFFTALIREYIKVFNPESIKIGSLSFSKKNLYDEIVDIVRAYCMSRDERSDRDLSEKYLSRALLLKSLYNHGVLELFGKSGDLKEPVLKKLMALISDVIDIEGYFALIPEPLILIDNEEIPVREYISRSINGELFAVCAKFESDIWIKGYLSPKPSSQNDGFAALYKKLEDGYGDFLKSCGI